MHFILECPHNSIAKLNWPEAIAKVRRPLRSDGEILRRISSSNKLIMIRYTVGRRESKVSSRDSNYKYRGAKYLTYVYNLCNDHDLLY